MLSPKFQWAHQLAVTSLCWPKTEDNCLTGCSNCTRLLAHEPKRYIMKPQQFEACVLVAREFVYHSPPCPQGRKNKTLGIFGGEPLMSPYFPQYVDILCNLVPEPEHRGLWTSLDWPNYTHTQYGPAAPHVQKLLGTQDGKHRGYLNWNMHDETNTCLHHPTLVSISDVVEDEKHRWQLINDCWLNREWSAAYALDAQGEPKFYFCEIAASFDRVAGQAPSWRSIGLPLTSRIWAHDLVMKPDADGILQPQGPYAEQIKACCSRCGHPLPFSAGRRDLDYKDDISPSNLAMLQEANSPMLARGDYELFAATEETGYSEQQQRAGYDPGRYIKHGVIRSTPVERR